jgi:hypothetical protein
MLKYTAMGMLAVPIFVLSLVTATPASADCTSSGGVTLCSQGEVRGSNTGDGPSGASPYYPYPCEYDYLCDDGGVGVVFDFDRPDFNPPGRPGGPNRPGGGRGGGGGGGRR